MQSVDTCILCNEIIYGFKKYCDKCREKMKVVKKKKTLPMQFSMNKKVLRLCPQCHEIKEMRNANTYCSIKCYRNSFKDKAHQK